MLMLSAWNYHAIMITFTVIGSMEHPLVSLSVYGSVEADGEDFMEAGVTIGSSDGGPGGGSGGTILLFLHSLTLSDSSILSSVGGHGSQSGGGGGGGGRIHFHWSDISTGDEYLPVATVKGTINTRFDWFLCLHSLSLICLSYSYMSDNN